MSKKVSRQDHEWDLVINSKVNLWSFHFKEVWQYRDLLRLLVHRDFISFYKQTVLGPIWFIIQPAIVTIVYVFLFGRVAKLPTDGIPQPLFYLVGITAWSYFSDCLRKTSTVLTDNASIFGKVYFPRVIIPLSVVISSLVKYGFQLLLLVGMIIYFVITGYEFSPTVYLLVFPILVFLMAVQGLGVGLAVSGLTTKYRDIALLFNFGIQLLMYATAVVYPLSTLGGTTRLIVGANPLTYIMEGMRRGLFGQGIFGWSQLGYVTLISFLVLFFGLIVFNRVEKNFVDTV